MNVSRNLEPWSSMIVRVEVPLTLTLVPPPFVQQMAGGMTSEQVQKIFPNVGKRMVALGNLAAETWKRKIWTIPGATGRPLKIGPYVGLNRETYSTSVYLAPDAWESDALTVTIYSDDKQAELIENGGDEIDMHDVLPNSEKARMSKDGKLYLRIPFRHATQSAEGGRVLPKAVIAAMRGKPKYLDISHRTDRSAGVSTGRTNLPVERFRYTPNPGRLTAGDIAVINRKAQQKYLLPPGHQGPPRPLLISTAYASRLEGLMRTGGPRHGGYLTIRTLSQANLEGWRIPPYPAQRLVTAVAREIEQHLDGWFDDALAADVLSWMEQAGITS